MRAAAIAVMTLVALAAASAPEFGAYTWLYANGSRIDVGYYGAPCVADWDGDGLKDLVLGQFTSGQIRFYRNSDSNDSPVLTTYSLIESSGTPISVPSG